ncbi:MAG: tyrosine-type recombinase/integrase, partial [Methylosarcina sp.]
MSFTSTQIEAIKPTPKVQDCTVEKLGMGRGCLLLRVHPNGDKIFYYRYFQKGAKRFALLGQFDSKGQRSWRGVRGDQLTLAAAKDGAKALAEIVSAHGDIESFEAEQKRLADEAACCGSFGQLLDIYIEHLRTTGKVRLKNVEGALNLHVRKAFSVLLSRKAHEITPGDIQAILAKLVNAGKTRQVNLVRTYLHAAFTLAARHDNDPRRVANGAVSFNLSGNPVALIPVISEFNRTGERVLTKEELGLFWRTLENAPSIPALFIKLNLALGGQRIEQLLRAEWTDYDLDSRILTLKDSKGRPGLGKRDHLVPLTDLAIELLQLLRAINGNAHPFAVSRAVRMDVGTPTKLVTKISAQLQQEHEIPPFRAGDLRRSCETHLAALGISKEVRAQL